MDSLEHVQRDWELGPNMEPHYTIYGEAWDAGRASVVALRSPQLQAAYGALLDHLEWGWIVLRRLQTVAEYLPIAERRPWHIHQCIAEYIEIDITDNFRHLAFTCRDRLPAEGRAGTVAAYDVLSEAEAINRSLRVLDLARGNVHMPRILREKLNTAPVAFSDWMKLLPGVLAAVEALEDATD